MVELADPERFARAVAAVERQAAQRLALYEQLTHVRSGSTTPPRGGA
jgi:hypothetical protein